MPSTLRIDPTSIELIGTDYVELDEKSRIVVNKKKREHLGPNFILSINEFNCLVAYPQVIWDEKAAEIRRYDSLNPSAKMYSRLWFGSAITDMNFDNQGRMVIPKAMREAVKIDSQIAVVGVGSWMEIWAAEEYAKYSEDPENYALARRAAFDKAYLQMKGLAS